MFDNRYETLVPVVILSTPDNTKLLEQMKAGFKRTVIWNKHQFKSINADTKYLDYLIDPSYYGFIRFFVLSFEDTTVRRWHT